MLRSSSLSIVAVLAIGCGSVTAANSGKGGNAGSASGTGGAAGAGGTGGTGGVTGMGGATGGVGASGGAGSGVGGTTGTGGAAGGVGGTGGAQPACYNGLTSTGNFVMATPGSGGIAQGGVIADGIYDLTSSFYAGPPVSDAPWQSVTIRVTGHVMDIVSMARTDTAPTYRSYMVTMQDTTLMSTTICGADRGVRGYTATATTLQIMNSNTVGTNSWSIVDTYTKR